MTIHSKEERRKHYILKCRFYDGTEKNEYEEKLKAHEIDKSHLPPPECMKDEYTLPYDEEARLKNACTVRFYESIWIHEQLNGQLEEERTQEYIAYGNEDFEADDGTPISLKALLWNRYYHWGGQMSDQESFRNWYRKFYASEPTNREKRAVKRRPGLIAKCKYYHGEETNPWDTHDAEGEKLLRKWYWDLEKQWVDELCMSFNSPLTSHENLKMWGLEEYFKNEGDSLSLINHILGWHNHIAENSHTVLNHDSAIECYKEHYLKLVP